MRKIIINADDLGISDHVNEEIEKCINLGVITSSTLMANAPAFDGGVALAKKYPQVSFGVHLNIIEFAPLSNKDIFQKYGMLDENGCFVEGAAFVVKYNDELKKAVYEEWDAQISKVENAGIIPTHCDSHEHTHAITDLKDILCRVLDAHNIKKVRRKVIPSIRVMLKERKHPSVVLDKSNAIQPTKRSVLYRRFHLFAVKLDCFKWNRQMSGRYKTANLFYAFRIFYKYHNIISLGGRNSTIELMCHPGHESFQIETDTLLKGVLKDGGDWIFISYIQL